MTRREPWMVCLLAIVTCGFYSIYWVYATTTELRQVSGREDINPTTELIINLLTCGLFGLYAMYRNQQIIHEVYVRRGQPHEDKSQLILILNIAVFVVIVTGYFALMIQQDEYNKLVDPSPSTV